MYYSSAFDDSSTSGARGELNAARESASGKEKTVSNSTSAATGACGLSIPAAGSAAIGTAPSGALAVLEAAERTRLIEEIRALEDLKGAITAVQARAAAAFDASTRRAQAAAGVKKEQLGRGVAAQIALARRESPHHGTRLLGLARILTTEMPHTLHALTLGVISEWRAMLLVRETACLTLADRQKVDEVVAGNLAELEQLGDRKLIARIKSLSYGLDPHAVVKRAAHAVSERFVSCRPAPDTMTYLTALLPVAQGVGVYAALTREADRLRAAGDPRTKGQIMADTFVERATGQARAEDARIEVQLIMTDQALLHGILPRKHEPEHEPGHGHGHGHGPGQVKDRGQDKVRDTDKSQEQGQDRIPTDVAESFVPDGAEPAVLAGYGMVPAQWARDLIRGPNPEPEPDDPQPDDPPSSGTYPDSHPDDRFDAQGRSGDQAGRPDHSQGPSGWAGTGRVGPAWGAAPPRRPDPQTETWLRRLYVAPDTGALTAMDSRARLVPHGLARLIAARDQICRTPWCGAPIRHYDHIQPAREGGPTTLDNIQGLCQACNQAKEAPGWEARTEVLATGAEELPPRGGTDSLPERPRERHTVVTRTPTGHVYRSTAPPLPAQHR
ncbi:DUF222 domain-containing protein [Arthrobacter sp. ATA002]|uniref:HNH endonuclease n=1 Tax=Arthrobacter sp. ATA002 TaxID=2991715 RepID=UPI0022A69596|nr:HNH endonuclease signature motif containing protein [Arthrobacter sp. ATA002]WAP51269.1 DUF222 domain-containing protein [Arthrobacter sp. ATA002]